MKKHLLPALLCDKPGYFALISVIIVGAVITAIVISVTFWGINQTKNSLTITRSAQARALANTCAEEALQQIRDSAAFTGSIHLTLGAGECDYSVVNSGGSNYVINATGSSTAVIRKVKITVDQRTPKINISSWQEVSDF